MSGRSEFGETHGGQASCLFPQKWQEVQDDRQMFKEALSRIEKKIDRIEASVDHHHKRMFVDNGTPSIQTRLAEGNTKFAAHEARLKDLEAAPKRMLAWAVGIVSIAGTMATGFVWLVKHIAAGVTL